MGGGGEEPEVSGSQSGVGWRGSMFDSWLYYKIFPLICAMSNLVSSI